VRVRPALLATTTIAAATLATLLAAGCSSTIGGRPVATPGAPTEPTFPTPRPSRTAAPPTTTAPHPSPTAPAAPTATAAPGAEELPPNDQGYVYIETKSGKTRCQISRTAVGCEAQFVNSPMQDGTHANGVNITADGAVRWRVGNLGDIPVVTLDYQNYRAQGWFIDATTDGTKFVNQRTGHGMFVSVEQVDTF
jgi:hypothetical protein